LVFGSHGGKIPKKLEREWKWRGRLEESLCTYMGNRYVAHENRAECGVGGGVMLDAKHKKPTVASASVLFFSHLIKSYPSTIINICEDRSQLRNIRLDVPDRQGNKSPFKFVDFCYHLQTLSQPFYATVSLPSVQAEAMSMLLQLLQEPSSSISELRGVRNPNHVLHRRSLSASESLQRGFHTIEPSIYQIRLYLTSVFLR